MGTVGVPGRGTHAEIDEELMKSWEYDKPDGTHVEVTYTDCRLVRFNQHWHVRRENGVPVVILEEMISRGGGWWYYKSLGEDWGPVDVECPLALLDIVPEPDAEYAREWRARVRAHHAAKVSLAGLKAGDRIQLRDHLSAGMSGRWLTVSRLNGRKIIAEGYRVPRTYIVAIERAA